MKREMFLDIGELGWSLYLSAHVRWLKRQEEEIEAIVMCYPDRRCLHEGIADRVLDVPGCFELSFNKEFQGCGKIKRQPRGAFHAFFKHFTPEGFTLRSDLLWVHFASFKGRAIYEPYPYSSNDCSRKEILVFPRARKAPGYKNRNLPVLFYVNLINALCDEFPMNIVRAVGIPSGAHVMLFDKPNFRNSVRENSTIQDMIDFCQTAFAAVGAQSAPPKLALLQGVPTFMIGHQKGRHTIGENWMRTPAGFFEIERDKKAYFSFNNPDCVKQIISFIKEKRL